VYVTTSRRTPPAMTAVVQAAAAKGECTLWRWGSDDAADNPCAPALLHLAQCVSVSALYRFTHWGRGRGARLLGMLAWADVVIVTGDSVSMASEAAAAKRPLFIAAGEVTGKLRSFHSSLIAAGVARPLRCPEDVCAPPPLASETEY
jgi:mitochondrial fission protein ELM1